MPLDRWRGFRWVIVVAVPLLALLAAAPASAQDPPPPPPPDTVQAPRDTIPGPPGDTARFTVPAGVLPGDTLPADSAGAAVVPDSLLPTPDLPRRLDPAPAGWSYGRREWTGADLALFHGFTLLDLLEGAAGLTLTRGGVYGQAAGLSSWGTGGGRLRVLLDGYELDALSAADYDLQRIALVDLSRVVLDRGLLETTIHIFTFHPEDRRPYSVIEVGTGNDQSRLLRGLFSRPIGSANLLTLGLDVLDTEGLPAGLPFSATGGVARFTHQFRPETGVQLEYRQTGVERANPLLPEQAGFRDLVLRGRSRLGDGLQAEAILGRSWRAPDEGDSLRLESSHDQAVLGVTWTAPTLWATGRATLRRSSGGGFPAPSRDLRVSAGWSPPGRLSVTGSARQSSLGDSGGFEAEGTANVAVAGGLSVFASAATGQRGLPFARDSLAVLPLPEDAPEGTEPDSAAVFAYGSLGSTVAAARVGAEWSLGSAQVGGALVTLDASNAVPFGFPFDIGVAPVDPGRVTGFEARADLPLPVPLLSVRGYYWRATGDLDQPYLPREQGRAAIEFHQLAYEGNREITLQLEGVRHGSSLVPLPGDTAGVFGAASEPYNLLNLNLQIRILDLRAFLIWRNLLNTAPADIPGLPFPRQRALYGVRWFFRN